MDRGDSPDVLIAGGGVAALEAALALRALGEGAIRVELLAPEPQFWYRPLAVAEPFALGEVRHFDLADLVAEAGATLSHGQLVSVDAARHLAYTAPGGAVCVLDAPHRLWRRSAAGRRRRPDVPRAADTEQIEHLLAEIEAGEVRRVAFAVPAGAVWSLPVYELALLTAGWLAARGMDDVKLALVTPEVEPLHLFGDEPSAAVRALLEERGIVVHTQAYPAEAREGELLLVGGDVLPADRVVALPRLQGQRIGGVAQTFEGFIPVDPHGRVIGTSDVYAAGDITTFTVKQGGHRGPAGGGRRRVDRGRVWHRDRAAAVQAGAPRPAPDGRRAAVPARRADGRCGHGEHRAALVAAGEDRRQVPRAVPGAGGRHRRRA